MENENQVDCEKVRACMQRLRWEVDQLKEKCEVAQQRLQCIEKLSLQVKWTVIGVILTMLAYAFGLIEIIKTMIK